MLQVTIFDNFSSLTSNISKLDLQANIKFQLRNNLADNQLESIAENQPILKPNSLRSKSIQKSNKLIVSKLG